MEIDFARSYLLLFHVNKWNSKRFVRLFEIIVEKKSDND